MNQKKAKKLRQILRNAVAQRDSAEVTAPGVVEKTHEATKQVAYTEAQKNRKPIMQNMPDDTAEGDYDIMVNGIKKKVVGYVPGTQIVQPNTVRGVYLSLKDGWKKKGLSHVG